jgi:hypothetical protein
MDLRRGLAPLAIAAFILAPPAALAQEGEAARPDAEAMIASALTAAPEAITLTATVTDLDGNVLRAGTSGFTCMPDDPGIPGDAPTCLDAGWQAFLAAWIKREEPPDLEELAFIYALQGGWPASNVDPYAGTTNGSVSRTRTSPFSRRTTRCLRASVRIRTTAVPGSCGATRLTLT